MNRLFVSALASLAVAVIAACSGVTGSVVEAPVTCGEGTHRCCASTGFECVSLATACTLSDSACGVSTNDAEAPPDAADACPAAITPGSSCSTPGLQCQPSSSYAGCNCANNSDGTTTWACFAGGL